MHAWANLVRCGNSRNRLNQHALRAAITPRPSLLAVLRACSFRLENTEIAWRFRWELGSVAPLLPPAPPPTLRNRVGSLANIPTEATQKQSNIVPTVTPDNQLRFLEKWKL